MTDITDELSRRRRMRDGPSNKLVPQDILNEAQDQMEENTVTHAFVMLRVDAGGGDTGMWVLSGGSATTDEMIAMLERAKLKLIVDP